MTLDDQLSLVVRLLRAREYTQARLKLKDYLKQHPEEPFAWYLLSFAVPGMEEKALALRRALQLHPAYSKAQARLEKLTAAMQDSVPARDRERRSLAALLGAVSLLVGTVGIIIFLMVASSRQVEGFPEPGKADRSASFVENADTGYTPQPTLEAPAVPPIAVPVVDSELPAAASSRPIPGTVVSPTATATFTATPVPFLDNIAAPEPHAGTPTTEPISIHVPQEPVPRQVIIRFDPGATQQQRVAYIEAIGGTISQTIAALDTVVVTVASGTVAYDLPESSIITASEPDYYVSALGGLAVSDPLYPEQWALPVIGAPEAWEALPVDAPAVTVAVIDSGICANHPDLAGRILDNGWDFVENDAIPQDELGHGCGVAGVIAANVNNDIGIAGVAPNAQIMPLRVLDAQGVGTYSDVAAAMVYATDHGAQIINLSLGGINPSSVLEDAVNYETSRDVLVVAAAGNTGTEGVLYPARYAPVIAVASVDRDLQRSSFSSYGPEVDLLAPGRDILTTSGGSYATVGGTSFSTAHVAGLAVLERNLGGSLVLGGIASVRGRITDTATPEIDYTSTPYVEELRVIGDDDRDQIEDTTAYPWSAVVYIRLTASFDLPFFRGQCTGSLIAPDHVLTAAHCLYYVDPESNEARATSVLYVAAGRNGNDEPFGRRNVTAIYIPPEWNGSGPAGSDYAVLALDSPFPSEAGAFRLGYFSNSYLSDGSRIFRAYPNNPAARKAMRAQAK